MNPKSPPIAETDPDAPPSEEELRQAAELREALADPSRENDSAALARAVVLAHSPRPLDDVLHRALVAQALAPRPGTVTNLSAVRARRARTGVLVAAVSSMAVAAAALVFQQPSAAPVAQVEPATTPPLRARPTQALFREPFAAHGGESARIDRIASARASDLRENMFARWDVR
jgi:hypothetical protein